MGNLWSKWPLAPDCFNSPNPEKRKSTIFDSPVLPQQQPDNEAPPTMDYEEAAKTLFSNGLDFANLAMSSDILSNSWAAISVLQSQIDRNHRSPPYLDAVKIREFEHPEYKIIAFVTSPVATTYLQEQSGLVPSSSSEASEFKFLCSKKNPSFSINKAAISLFNSLQDQLSLLKAQVATSSKSIPHIITGDCLGGSIASLFTLWLLRTLDLATAKRPLCITFGSPLIGNSGFQQAISQYSSWTTCFLHVAHKDDGFPKLFQSSTMEQSIYKPFGTFLVCSESGGACFEAPESIIELLAPKSPETAQTFNYKSIITCLERRLICKNHYAFSVPDTDSFKVGITAQLAAIGLMQIQPQNMDIDALLGKIVMSEHNFLEGKNQVFDPAEELNTMKVKLANLEWYKKKCEDEGPRSGYYDSFKNKMAPRDHTAVKFIKPLTIYWQRVVEEAQERPQREGAPLRIRWLFGGTNYQRMVEPFHIAEYYKLGKRGYISQGRSEHFKLLEEWLDKHQKQSGKSVSNNWKMKKIMLSITEDSCFWAHVEEARISCRLLNSRGSNGGEIENLVRFEEYVMGLLKNYAVSPDIFLESSSYMQWWREYEDILGKQMMGASHNSEIARFMKDEDYHQYKSGAIVAVFAIEEKAGSALEIETKAVLQALRTLETEKEKQEQQREEACPVGAIIQKKIRVDILIDNISIPYLPLNPEESPWTFRVLFQNCNDILTCLGSELIKVVHVPHEANGLADWVAKAHRKKLLPAFRLVRPGNPFGTFCVVILRTLVVVILFPLNESSFSSFDQKKERKN